jgi:hypothetical protein
MGSAPEAIAAAVAPELKREIDSNIAAGRGPDGQPWQLTQVGKVPLRNAAKHVTVEASGGTVIATVDGAPALHHSGEARGRIKRLILPSVYRLSDRMLSVITDAMSKIVRGG